MVGSLTSILEKARADGALRPELDPAGTARAMVALEDGLQVQWLLDRESVDIGDDLGAYVQRLLTVDR